MRDIIRKIIPAFALNFFRYYKKSLVRNSLSKAIENGNGSDLESIKAALINCGIKSGDHVMVHSSLSKIGPVNGGAETIVEALKDVIGKEGIILMPTSPVDLLQYEYVEKSPVLDVRNTPSKMGKITEVFRISSGVKRSLHPTEPIAAWGKDAVSYIENHHLFETPYHSLSPYMELVKNNGKILYIGVSLDNAGTHLHTLEDACDVGVPVYLEKIYSLKVIDDSGNELFVSTKVHNPEWSKKRKCDELLPLFALNNAYNLGHIGNAKTYIFDAKKMFETMMKSFNDNGVTMYNPKGNR